MSGQLYRYTVVLPLFAPDGASTDALRSLLRASILQECGGYTSFMTSGAWLDPLGVVVHDQGETIMVDCTERAFEDLRPMIEHFRVRAWQQEVYVTRCKVHRV